MERAPSSVSHWTNNGHSHNDYEQENPLADALTNGFYSVEADIWWVQNRVLISHFGYFFTGALKELYLDPLQERVSRLGSVYGDGKPFILWIELKEAAPALVKNLQALLAQYPMLTRFTDATVTKKPVTVILTGLDDAKKSYVAQFQERLACRDSHEFRADDPPADNRWCWYALRWWNYFQWNGQGEIPRAEKDRLRAMVASIHSKGRKVRFWDAPDTPALWEESEAAGVDLIETDSLQAFREHFENRPAVIPM